MSEAGVSLGPNTADKHCKWNLNYSSKQNKKHLHAHIHDLSAPKPALAATRPKRKLHETVEESGGPGPSL